MKKHALPAIVAALFLFVFTSNLSAQNELKSGGASSDFARLQAEVDAARNNPNIRANMASQWLRRKSDASWREQIDLLPMLHGYDQVDKRRMSVRWTGRISVPANGQYVFEQLRTFRTNGTMKLWVDDVLVMESGGNETDAEPNEGELSFRSSPVALRAGVPAAFKLEYVHDMRNVKLDPLRPMGLPVAVLMWESDVLEKQIVPKEAFSQEGGQTGKAQAGLKGEYFADASFGRKVGERTDAAIEFIWDQGTVFNDFVATRRSLVKANLSRVTDVNFLNSLSDEDAESFAKTGIVHLLSVMSAPQRMALIEAVSTQPRILKAIPTPVLADQLQIIYMLPDGLSTGFLLKWAEACDPPVFEPGTLIGGRGTYVLRNLHAYRRIGKLFGSLEQAEEAIADQLENEDGSCNLGLAYVLISASRENNTVAGMLHRIAEALANADISGDARATWHLAKAFALETVVVPVVRPNRALPDLRLALQAAQSDELRARIVMEIVARQLTLGEIEQAKEALSAARTVAPESQTKIDTWFEEAEDIRERQRQARENRRRSAQGLYATSLKRHQETAREKNDTKQVVRIQNVLRELESSRKAESDK